MRLAIIVSHPIQYYSPWFRQVAAAMGCVPRSQETKRPKDEEPSEANRRWPQGKRREAQPRANQGQNALQSVGLTLRPGSLTGWKRGRRDDGGPNPLLATSNSQHNALRVFYLWDFGVTEKRDKGFGQMVKWDVDLLEGYDHEFVPNVSRRPGTDWFGGLDNPELLQRVKAFAPDAVLQFGYNYKSLVNFDLRWNTKRAPLLFRGDSHLLAGSMEHGAWSVELKRWVRELGLWLLFKRFACFLAVGKANTDYFRAHGVPESKIVRCPHVVDNEFFRREPEDTRGPKDQGLKGLRDQGFKGQPSLRDGLHGNQLIKDQEPSVARRREAKPRANEEPESAAADVGSVSPAIMGRGQTKRPRGLRGELGIAEDELVFLFAGKLEEKKQPLLLLEAFLAADIERATLLFVGSGELEGALKEKAKGISHGLTRMDADGVRAAAPTGLGGECSSPGIAYGPSTAQTPPVPGSRKAPSEKTGDCKLPAANCGHRVLFVPFQNQSAMPDVYRTGDVLVLPSKGRYETWGLAVNEAACCGLPAIVSSHVGCGPDLIEDGVTGWVFEAGNVTALQRALETAAANRGRLPAMGEALQERVSAEYSYANATKALLAGLGEYLATDKEDKRL